MSEQLINNKFTKHELTKHYEDILEMNRKEAIGLFDKLVEARAILREIVEAWDETGLVYSFPEIDKARELIK